MGVDWVTFKLDPEGLLNFQHMRSTLILNHLEINSGILGVDRTDLYISCLGKCKTKMCGESRSRILTCSLNFELVRIETNGQRNPEALWVCGGNFLGAL